MRSLEFSQEQVFLKHTSKWFCTRNDFVKYWIRLYRDVSINISYSILSLEDALTTKLLVIFIFIFIFCARSDDDIFRQVINFQTSLHIFQRNKLTEKNILIDTTHAYRIIQRLNCKETSQVRKIKETKDIVQEKNKSNFLEAAT